MFTFVAFGAFLVAGGADSDPRSQFNHLRMPLHGTVHNGILYGFFDDDWFIPDIDRAKYPHLDGIPLGKIAKKNWKKYEFFRGLDCFNFRHSIGHGCIWFSDGPYRFSGEVRRKPTIRVTLPQQRMA
jgi:hypothetical protein